MKPKIIVGVFNHLVTDQRVEKVCNTLHTAGYPILLVGNNWKGLPAMERPYPFFRLKIKSKSLKTAYAEFQWKLYKFLKKHTDKNTIILANDLDILYACFRFAKKNRLPLVYDSHEIFTELPHIQGRVSQKVWRFLENKIIREIPYIMTESESYAQWFVDKYKINKPLVINNFPRRNFRGENAKKNVPSPEIILYQGAINAFRGIEAGILSMKYLEDCEFWIVGDGPKRMEYEALAQKEKITNVKFWGSVTPNQLREITPQADLGLSLEENAGLSYYLSLPNKVADYIQGGIPIVGSDFPETKGIIEKYKIGVIAESRNPQEIAEKIKEVLARPKGFYLENLRQAAKDLCWEVQEDKILKLFDKVAKDYHFL